MLKKLAGGTAIAGALGWSALGLGAGLANAAPIPQVGPGTVHGAPLPADNDDWWGGHGHDHGGWRGGDWHGGGGDWRGGDWDGGGWGGGGPAGWGWLPPPCASVGWVSGCI